MSEEVEGVQRQGEEDTETDKGRKLREVLSDAFAFIRSAEANQAFATVTFEQLMNDQIVRNGDTDRSNSAQYDPYSANPNKKEVASQEPASRANFLGAADTTRPTKLDRVLALVNVISEVVKEIKNREPVDVAAPEVYVDNAETDIPE